MESKQWFKYWSQNQRTIEVTFGGGRAHQWVRVLVLDSNEPRILALDGGPKPFSFPYSGKYTRNFTTLDNLGLGFFLEEKNKIKYLKPPTRPTLRLWMNFAEMDG